MKYHFLAWMFLLFFVVICCLACNDADDEAKEDEPGELNDDDADESSEFDCYDFSLAYAKCWGTLQDIRPELMHVKCLVGDTEIMRIFNCLDGTVDECGDFTDCFCGTWYWTCDDTP